MTNAMISSEEAQSYQSKGLSPRRRTYEVGMRGLLYLSAGITCLLLLFLIGYILYRGLPNLNWTFLTSQESVLRGTDGIMPAIQNTLYVIVVTLIFILPLGVGAALWLNEYGSRSPMSRYIRLGVNNLAGVPSVVFGLFGLSFFVTFLGMGVSLLAGVLTLAVLTLPVIINTTEEALRQVPDAWREASYALGGTKSQTIVRVVLPSALPGMLTGAILGLSRAAGETAAIMFTAAVFYTPKMPDSVFSAVMALPYHMYVLATAGTEIEKTRPLQYGTALVLLVLVLGMNLAAVALRDRMQRRRR